MPPGVRLVRQEDRGFRAAAARHLGATHTTGEVLVFLDADTTPEPGLVEALTRLPRLQPDLLAVGRRRHAALAGTPAEAPVEETGPAHELPEPAWLRTAYAASRDLLDADDLSCRFVISAVLACTRWWYDEVGGFDPSFTAYGGEDWELAHRSWLAGGLVAHVPTAVAWHDGPDAGAAPRGVATVETAAIAGRIGTPGLAPHGLLAIGGRTVPVDRGPRAGGRPRGPRAAPGRRRGAARRPRRPAQPGRAPGRRGRSRPAGARAHRPAARGRAADRRAGAGRAAPRVAAPRRGLARRCCGGTGSTAPPSSTWRTTARWRRRPRCGSCAGPGGGARVQGRGRRCPRRAARCPTT